MSGFAGIIHLSGAPVAASVVVRMMGSATRHGGGSFNLECDDDFAIGHSLLASVPESALEEQPLTFDGNTWIVGDVRIDGRSELLAALRAEGVEASMRRPDIELVLHAYAAWGEQCVDHLIGDFAFTVWSRDKRRVFCARDHFGVKPFYYVHRADTFIFSNEIRSLRAHPDVSDELNEASICDFLAFGYNLDEKATCFANVQRIAPGHTLFLKASAQPVMRSYRKLDFSNRITYKKPAKYVEHFSDLFKKAVADRLRSDRVSFELSGGLDSTSVATLSATLNACNPTFSGLGITTDSLLAPAMERESDLAKSVAEKAGIAHVVVKAGQPEDFYTYCGTAQPYSWPFAATSMKFADVARSHSRVLLTGQCGDVLLQGSGHQVLDDFRDNSFPRFLGLRLRNVLAKRSLRAFGLRSLMHRNHPQLLVPTVPAWLNQDLLERSRSEERWKELFYGRDRYPRRCRAELTFDELRMPFWSHLFESYYHDLLSGIDCRHPFFDLRLIEYLCSIPATQKSGKQLLRESMVSLLPDPVRLRDKAILRHDLVQMVLKSTGELEKRDLSLESCASWIDTNAYRNALISYAKGQEVNLFTIMCPLSLQRWQTGE